MINPPNPFAKNSAPKKPIIEYLFNIIFVRIIFIKKISIIIPIESKKFIIG